ncbi:MAG: cytochrome b/b6 domain-containing protein [Sedimentisphaerales bacterium]|nr:cytochrome b/b6 domain-containing protein [Sedimentisphaerales bacterium]
MFRIVSSAVFLATLAGTLLHYVIFAVRSEKIVSEKRWYRPINILKTLVFMFTLILIEQGASAIEKLRKLLYLLALLCFVVLAVTGFVPVLIYGRSIWGYWLMVHATAAGVFALCAAALVVMWAENCRLSRLLQYKPKCESSGEHYELSLKLCFWIIVILLPALILSSILAMFLIFGTDGQELLLQLHRYCAVSMVSVVIIHTYLLVLSCAGR